MAQKYCKSGLLSSRAPNYPQLHIHYISLLTAGVVTTPHPVGSSYIISFVFLFNKPIGRWLSTLAWMSLKILYLCIKFYYIRAEKNSAHNPFTAHFRTRWLQNSQHRRECCCWLKPPVWRVTNQQGVACHITQQEKPTTYPSSTSRLFRSAHSIFILK